MSTLVKSPGLDLRKNESIRRENGNQNVYSPIKGEVDTSGLS